MSEDAKDVLQAVREELVAERDMTPREVMDEHMAGRVHSLEERVAALEDDDTPEPQQTPAERRTGQKLLDMVRPGWRERPSAAAEEGLTLDESIRVDKLRHATETGPPPNAGECRKLLALIERLRLAALRSSPTDTQKASVGEGFAESCREAAAGIPEGWGPALRVAKDRLMEAADRLAALRSVPAEPENHSLPLLEADVVKWAGTCRGYERAHKAEGQAMSEAYHRGGAEAFERVRDRIRVRMPDAQPPAGAGSSSTGAMSGWRAVAGDRLAAIEATHAALTAAGVPEGTLVERIEQLIEGWEDAEVERDTEVMDNDRLRRLLAQRAPEGERLEGWVPNWDAGTRTPEDDIEFFEVQNDIRCSWTPATLIIHRIVPPEGGGGTDGGRFSEGADVAAESAQRGEPVEHAGLDSGAVPEGVLGGVEHGGAAAGDVVREAHVARASAEMAGVEGWKSAETAWGEVNAAHAFLTVAGVPEGTLEGRIGQLIEGWEDAEIERETEVMDNDRLRRLLAQRAPEGERKRIHYTSGYDYDELRAWLGDAFGYGPGQVYFDFGNIQMKGVGNIPVGSWLEKVDRIVIVPPEGRAEGQGDGAVLTAPTSDEPTDSRASVTANPETGSREGGSARVAPPSAAGAGEVHVAAPVGTAWTSHERDALHYAIEKALPDTVLYTGALGSILARLERGEAPTMSVECVFCRTPIPPEECDEERSDGAPLSSSACALDDGRWVCSRDCWERAARMWDEEAPAVGAEVVAWRRRVRQPGTEWSGWGMWMQDPALIGDLPSGDWEVEVQPLGVATKLPAPEPSEPTHTDLIARWQERERPMSALPVPGGTEGETL